MLHVQRRPRHFIGIDTGGTFTDFIHVGPRYRLMKILSSPEAPEKGFFVDSSTRTRGIS